MKRSNLSKWRFLYKLHRYIGLFSALILIMLSITGIALNHTETLQLDSQMVQSNTLLNWYGIQAPQNFKSFTLKNHWLTKVDQQIYFDHSVLLKTDQALQGGVETDSFIVIALKNSLLLISLQGELIEQSPIDQAITKIGLNAQQHIVLQSTTGLIHSTDELLSWQPLTADENIVWATTTKLPENIATKIKHKVRTSILPLERVFLDIHSGRFFGYLGVIIVDISGVCLIVLALSGCAIWLKHKLRKFKHTKTN